MTALSFSSAGDLAAAIRSGDRRALARGITLVESLRPADRDAAEEILTQLTPATMAAFRVGISGAPGVGKSSFIAALGPLILRDDQKLAVLAVDPTSPVTGGSILGDKTRMADLARDPRAFIRPSPSSGGSAGLARRSREAMLLCAAAGFDWILLETVGVGQSDIAVADMTDLFVLLIGPGGGDELQGLKRGVLERADLIVITKDDGDLKNQAGQTAAEYRHALQLLRGGPTSPPVMTCSALEGGGLAAIWQHLNQTLRQAQRDGDLARRRAHQAGAWLRAEFLDGLLDLAQSDAVLAQALREAEQAALSGQAHPVTLARRLIDHIRRGLAGRPTVR